MLSSGSNYYLMQLYSKLPRDVKGHSMRVSILMNIIANGYVELGFDPGERFAQDSREKLTQTAREAGFYHDIGKSFLPRRLLKKAELTPDESAEIKRHTLYVENLLDPCIQQLSTAEQQYYRDVKCVCAAHHERWDGRGYPHSLSGKDISVLSRICAVADAYDIMTWQRDSSRRLSHTEAVERIMDGSGIQFDPDVVSAFLLKADEIRQLAKSKPM